MADTRNNGMGFPVGSMVKNLAINAGDMGSIPGLVRSPAGGNGNLFQYSCRENQKIPWREEPGGLQSIKSLKVSQTEHVLAWHGIAYYIKKNSYVKKIAN